MPSKRDIITSPHIEELKRKKKKQVKLFTSFCMLIFIILIIGLSFLSKYPKFLIKEIIVSGTHIVDSFDIEESVKQNISGYYLYLFAKSNSVIYPNEKITKNLYKNFPRIEKVSVKRKGWNTLTIDITEKTGSYLWCGNSYDLSLDTKNDNCYFMNNDGVIFDKAPYFSGNVYFRFYVLLKESDKDPLNQTIFDNTIFKDTIYFTDELKKLGFKPVVANLSNEQRYEILLEGSNGQRFIFKKGQDVRKLLLDIQSALNKGEFANDIKTNYASLLYVDLRFKNKVIYKFNE